MTVMTCTIKSRTSIVLENQPKMDVKITLTESRVVCSYYLYTKQCIINLSQESFYKRWNVRSHMKSRRVSIRERTWNFLRQCLKRKGARWIKIRIRVCQKIWYTSDLFLRFFESLYFRLVLDFHAAPCNGIILTVVFSRFALLNSYRFS